MRIIDATPPGSLVAVPSEDPLHDPEQRAPVPLHEPRDVLGLDAERRPRPERADGGLEEALGPVPTPQQTGPPPVDGVAEPGGVVRQCPKCGSASLLRQEGCDVCTDCGYSKCG